MNPLSSNDLSELVNANIISEEKAVEIENYFNEKKAAAPSKLNIIFGVLGALLVSLAIVLFIAHNWDELSVTFRTICAFLPLFVGQGLCVYSLYYRKENSLWLETSAIVLFFAAAASISLISQVYHIDGTLASFLFTWIIITAPLVYIMRSTVVALLVIAAATRYSVEVGYGYRNNSIPWLYLGVLLFLIPHYLQFVKHKRTSNLFYWYNWFIAISLLLSLGSFAGKGFESPLLLFAAYLLLLTVFYQAGKILSAGNKNFFTNPFLQLGIAGIIITLMMLSFEEFWSNFHRNKIPLASPFIYLSVLLFASAVYNFLKKHLQHGWHNIDPVELSVFVFGIFLLSNSTIGVFIINAWLLVIALWYIRKGNVENNFGLLNFGLFIIACIAVARFFDDDIPFVWRGIFFLITGIGFFAANYSLVKKRKEIIKKDKS